MATTKTVAVAGKGGTGKSTLAALLIRELVGMGQAPILAVDADPNANLGELLGTRAAVTVGGLREAAFMGVREIPTGWDKQSWIEYKMHEAIEEAAGYDLLVMGRPEGPGCYCYANNLLREYIKTLASEYAWVVMDNEGGLEHLSRHTTRDVDVMFIVTDPSVRGMRTVERISELVDEMGLVVAERYVVVSRVPQGVAVDGLMEHTTVPLGGVVPQDDALFSNDLSGKDVFALPEDAISLGAVRGLIERYLEI
ncbi:MAG: AAA family ATPase [Actinobacteria bacterium]|nr:AAA family ATPase [Actinomycetota bacterium]